MKNRIKQSARLLVEQLKERCVPAYLAYSEQPFAIRGVSDSDRVRGFQLEAETYTSSQPYQTPNGQTQFVASVPAVFSEISAPTQAEYDLLFSQFGDFSWSSAVQTLADNSLIIADAEALGPSRQLPAVAAATSQVGQSLFIRYDPTGVDPTAASIHWLQFVTTNFPLGAAPNGTPFIDNDGSVRSPYYDSIGGIADGTGFVDVPARPVRNDLITWHADLFLVEEMVVEGSGLTHTIWQGVSWGWETRVGNPFEANRAPQGASNTVVTPENTAYVFAPAVFGFTDPDDSPANNL